MAEGSYSVQSGNSSVEDMDEGSHQVRVAEMVGGSDYEEFGAFGGYGTLTSFDIHLLRAFDTLGSGFHILANEPWELESPVLAQTLVEALQLDPETLANETEAHAASVARSAASNRAARAAAAAARRSIRQVVAHHMVPTQPATGDGAQPGTYSEAQGPAPEAILVSPPTSQMSVVSEMAAPGAPAVSTHSQTASLDQAAAARGPSTACAGGPSPACAEGPSTACAEGPSTACAFSQAPSASETDATWPQAGFLGQKDVFDFTQPAGVSGMAFTRPKRPAPAQEAATEDPSAASGGPQAAPAREAAATGPKNTKSGKAVAKTRWVEPQKVVTSAAANSKTATSIPE
ncbi:PREDICTED: melanoma-associated antigen D4-like, partial [Chinchilla lanigera]